MHPHRREVLTGIGSGVVAIAALVSGFEFGRFHKASSYSTLVEWIAAGFLLIFGSIAIRRIAAGASRFITRTVNPGAGGSFRLVATGVGFLILLFAFFAVLGTSIQHLLIGAGVAGVVVGIAAQQSLGNIFASLVLLFARPFVVGDHIRIRSGTIGVLDVWVIGSGLTYVTVLSDEGPLKIPNSVMLASGIAKLRPEADKTGADPDASPSGAESS